MSVHNAHRWQLRLLAGIRHIIVLADSSTGPGFNQRSTHLLPADMRSLSLSAVCPGRWAHRVEQVRGLLCDGVPTQWICLYDYPVSQVGWSAKDSRSRYAVALQGR